MQYTNTSSATICIETLRSKLDGKPFKLAPGEQVAVDLVRYTASAIALVQPLLDRYVRLGELNGKTSKKPPRTLLVLEPEVSRAAKKKTQKPEFGS